MVSPIERIAALPSRAYQGPRADRYARDCAEKWTERLRRSDRAPPLRPIQGWLLEELHRENGTPRGVLGAIGVGHGKTLLSLLAGTVAKSPRTLLFIPSAIRDQYQRNLEYWLRYYRFIPPTVLTYGRLSRPEATSALRSLAPTLIVADECHMLRYATSARTKRVMRYLKERPDTRFCGLSGTVTSTGLLDYAHMLDWTLRDLCPLPAGYHDREQWAACLDVGSEAHPLDWRAVWPIVGDSDPMALDRAERKATFQRAFQDRLRKTPCFVSTSDASVGASLVLRRFVPPCPPEIKGALERLESTWEMPDGEPVIESIDYHRNSRHLSLGFFYRRVWPHGKDHEWLDARREWWSAVRTALRGAREGRDSPGLLAAAAIRREGSPSFLGAWDAWDRVRSRVPPPSDPVWLTDEVLRSVVQWRTRHPNALVWYSSIAVGERLYSWGFDVYGQGSPAPRSPGTDPLVAASLLVHGTGRELQTWSDQLVLEPMPSGSAWEQLLGRTHRQGQTADTVRCSVLAHTVPLRVAMETAISKAQYIENTTGQRQKLNFCSWTLDE